MIKKKILSWIYVIFWCVVIFFFSSIPDLKIKQLGFWDFVLRKIAHITEYAILNILVLRAFIVSTDFSKKRIYIFSIIFSTFYALLDEIHQYFVPGRHFAITDLLIDFVGVIAGLILWDKIFNKTLKI